MEELIVSPFDYSFLDVPFLFPPFLSLSLLFLFSLYFFSFTFILNFNSYSLSTSTHQQTNTTFPLTPIPLSPDPLTRPSGVLPFHFVQSRYFSTLSIFRDNQLFPFRPLHLGGKNGPSHPHTHTFIKTHDSSDNVTHIIPATRMTASLSYDQPYSFHSFCMSTLLLLPPCVLLPFRCSLYPTLFFAIAR